MILRNIWMTMFACLFSSGRAFRLPVNSRTALPESIPLSSSLRQRRRHCCGCMLLRTNNKDEEWDGNDTITDKVKNHVKFSATESDWMQAELTLRQAPTEPHPDLTPEAVALACCRSLQWVDYPATGAGLVRCFDFFTFECRKAVTARQGGNTVEKFQEFGVLSPALQPFMGAHRVDVGLPGTLTKAQPPLRGAIMSFAVTIQVAKVRAVQHASGMQRGGVVSEPPAVHMVMRLEQQRRPPNQGCWLVRELLDVRYAFAGDLGNAHVGG